MNNNNIFSEFDLSGVINDEDGSNVGEQNDDHLPQKPFRCLIAASSGSGKTNILIKLLINGELKFDKLYLFARGASITEPKYLFLIKFYTSLAEQAGVDLNDILVVGNEPEDIPDVEEMDASISNLIIFDDWMADKKLNEGKILSYFIKGRKHNCSLFYLTQSFYSTPKNIRLNCNYFSIFNQSSKREINGLVNELAGGIGFPPEVFKKAYQEAVSYPHGWVLVDLKTQDPSMKLRAGFSHPLRTDAIEEE